MKNECVLFPLVDEPLTQDQLDTQYSELINSETQPNDLYRIILRYKELGAFVYDISKSQIVFANEIFLKYHQTSLSKLRKESFRRFIFSRLHYDDACMVRRLELASRFALGNNNAIKILRIRQLNDMHQVFHFVVFTPKDQDDTLKHIRIGVQINGSLLSDDEVIVKLEIQRYRNYLSCLSKREMEILDLIVHGYTDKEVGAKLHISCFTAQKHRKNMLNKLHLRNTAHLSYIAGKSGII